MAIEFSATGQTAITWTLADTERSASMSNTYRSARAITNGTGPNQATVAYATRLTIAGSGVTSLDPRELIVDLYSAKSAVSMTRVKEILVSVPSGPTGGWILFGGPTGPSGITGMSSVGVRVGGQLHWLDYQSGAIGSANPAIGIQRGTTGTYTVDVTVAGLGAIGLASTLPGAPTFTQYSAQTFLSWTTPYDGGSSLTRYRLYKNGVVQTNENDDDWYNQSADTYNVGDVIQVSAVNAVGEGPKSLPVTVVA